MVDGYIEIVCKFFYKGIVVVVFMYFSNFDFILIGYVLDIVMGLFFFSYGVGFNLYNIGYIVYFMNCLGVYWVDCCKKNGIYLEMFKVMSMFFIKCGVNSLFFFGGICLCFGCLE